MLRGRKQQTLCSKVWSPTFVDTKIAAWKADGKPPPKTSLCRYVTFFAFASEELGHLNDRVERCCLSRRSTSNLSAGTWELSPKIPDISDTSRVFQIGELHDLKLWGNPVTLSFWRILAAKGQERLSRTTEVWGITFNYCTVSYEFIVATEGRQSSQQIPKYSCYSLFPLTTLRWRIGISHHQRLFAFWVNLWSSPQPSLGGWRGTPKPPCHLICFVPRVYQRYKAKVVKVVKAWEVASFPRCWERMKHIFDDFVNMRVTFPDVWSLRLDRRAKAKKDREGGTEPMKGILSHAWSQRIFLGTH